MKILVFSDSHSTLRFMKAYIEAFSPDAVVHLGDHYEDGQTIRQMYSISRFYQVPGNCDKYRIFMPVAETLVEKVCGVKLFMTHGHNQHVKMGLGSLLAQARRTDAQAVLFGHTHEAYCQQEEDRLWVINPGSCGFGGGSAALLEVDQGKITACRILRQADLDDITSAEGKPGQ